MSREADVVVDTPVLFVTILWPSARASWSQRPSPVPCLTSCYLACHFTAFFLPRLTFTSYRLRRCLSVSALMWAPARPERL